MGGWEETYRCCNERGFIEEPDSGVSALGKDSLGGFDRFVVGGRGGGGGGGGGEEVGGEHGEGVGEVDVVLGGWVGGWVGGWIEKRLVGGWLVDSSISSRRRRRRRRRNKWVGRWVGLTPSVVRRRDSPSRIFSCQPLPSSVSSLPPSLLGLCGWVGGWVGGWVDRGEAGGSNELL